MRTGKRTLAGVAAAALGAALIPFVGVGVSQAAIGAMSADGPLRASTINSSWSAADDSTATGKSYSTNGIGQTYVPATSAGVQEDVAYVALVSAPGVQPDDGSGYLLLGTGTKDSVDTEAYAFSGITEVAGADDSFVLMTDSTGNVVIQGGPTTGGKWVYANGGADVPTGQTLKTALFMSVNNGGTDDTVQFVASASGTYTFLVSDNAGGTSPYTWSVTTTGAPTVVSFDPTTQNIANQAGDEIEFTIEALDANGNATQLIGSEEIDVTSGDDSLTLGEAAFDKADMADGSDDFTVTVAAGGVANAGPKTMTGTGNAFLGGIEGTATINVVDVAATTNMVVTKPTNAYDVEDGAGSASDPYQWQIKPGVVVVEVESTLSSSATTNEVNFTAYYDDTTSADIIATGIATASGGKATFSTTVSPAQAVAGKEIYFYDGTKWLEAAFTAESQLFEVAPAAQVRAQTIGGTTSWVVGAGTQYGEPLAGWEVKLTTTSASRNASKSITATTDATGVATVSLPDTSTSTTILTDAVSITVKLGTTQSALNVTTGNSSTPPGTTFSTTVRYSSTGTVTLSQLKFAGVIPSEFTRTPVVPYTGAVYAAAGAAAGTLDDSRSVAVTVIASLPGSTVTFTGSEGVGFFSAGTTQSIADGKATLDVVSDPSSGLATAYYYSTKTGSNTVTATSSSGSELSGAISNISNSYAARNFQMTAPATATVGTIVTINLKITDGFGNPVTTFTEGPGYIAMETDRGILAGAGSIVFVQGANTSGEATVALISTEQGIANVRAEGVNGQFGDDADVPITGFAASVYQAAVAIEWVAGPTEKSIVITGERGTVNNKPGIMVDGLTVGIDEGAKVKPWIRFPGQGSYSEGSARPTVDADGEFYWQRKTGKKIYVYFTTEDGSVKSERIIIPAK